MAAAKTLTVDAVLNKPELGAYRGGLFIACSALMLLDGYDAYITSNLAPTIAKSLSIPVAAMGAAFTAQAIGIAIGVYTVPLLADRFGRRWVIISCTVLFALFTLLTTQATTLQGLVVIRLLAFMSFGGALPNIVALLAEFAPDTRREKLLTWVFTAHGLGASLGGFLAPTFVHFFSWRAAFWTGGAILLVLAPILYFHMPESCRYLLMRNPRDPRIGRTLRRIDPAFKPEADVEYVTAEEPRRGSPLPGLFRDGRAKLTLLLWLANGVGLAGTATASVWLPSLLHVLGGLDTAVATRMSAVSALGSVVGPMVLALLMTKIGMSRALAITFALGAASTLAFTLVTDFPALGWALGACFGLFVFGSQAGLNSLVASSYPTAMRSTGIGWAGGMGRLTTMAGPGLVGAMLAGHWSAGSIYAALAAPFAIAAVAMMLLYRLRRAQPAPAPAVAVSAE